ncbi:hypothetical protein [Paenibacillus elgii]
MRESPNKERLERSCVWNGYVVEGQGMSEQQAREMLNQFIPSLKRWA